MVRIWQVVDQRLLRWIHHKILPSLTGIVRDPIRSYSYLDSEQLVAHFLLQLELLLLSIAAPRPRYVQFIGTSLRI